MKSTTRAQDGLYVYDTVQRLYDARFGDGDVKDIRRYISLGPLGRAFASAQRVRCCSSTRSTRPTSSSPTTSCTSSTACASSSRETGDEIVAKQRPVVIITSNNEKELPDAFLRRCVFHFIDFPDQELMKRIVRVHHPKSTTRSSIRRVVAFYELRAVPRLRKRPSTSELIDWIAVLKHAGIGAKRLVRELPFLGVLLKKEQDMELLRTLRPASGVGRR